MSRDLSTCTVKRLIKSSDVAAGFDQNDVDAFSGHSMRVGAAQDLLCAGYDAAAIMRGPAACPSNRSYRWDPRKPAPPVERLRLRLSHNLAI